MGLYSKQSASGLNASNSFRENLKNIKHELSEFPSAELAKAKIVIRSTQEQIPVQFNPQSLSFVGDVTETETPVVETDSAKVVNIYSKPTITLNLELLFDATSDDGVIDHIKGGNFIKNTIKQTKNTATARLKNGSKIFPTAYGDVAKQVDFFYDIMTTYTKRNVEFAWNQLSFTGDVSSINVNILLFDTSGNPIRAKIGLSIKQTLSGELLRTKSKSRIKLPTRTTRK